MEFTEDLCWIDLICVQIFETSFQIITLWSKEQEANIFPKLGWAHVTCQTGPSCPFNSDKSLGFDVETSNIFL